MLNRRGCRAPVRSIPARQQALEYRLAASIATAVPPVLSAPSTRSNSAEPKPLTKYAPSHESASDKAESAPNDAAQHAQDRRAQQQLTITDPHRRCAASLAFHSPVQRPFAAELSDKAHETRRARPSKPSASARSNADHPVQQWQRHHDADRTALTMTAVGSVRLLNHLRQNQRDW